LWSVDEPDAIARAGTNFPTSFGALDLPACTRYWRHAWDGRLPLCAGEELLLSYAITDGFLNYQLSRIALIDIQQRGD